MTESQSPQERRSADRETRRLACELVVDETHHSAVVINLSLKGLFLRTNARPDPGRPVGVLVRRPGGRCWEIGARVARSHGVSPALPLISAKGLGLEIVSAPPDFYEFVTALGDHDPA